MPNDSVRVITDGTAGDDGSVATRPAEGTLSEEVKEGIPITDGTAGEDGSVSRRLAPILSQNSVLPITDGTAGDDGSVATRPAGGTVSEEVKVKNLRQVFDVIDSDNSGSITVSELRSVFSIMGERTTHAECKEIAEKYGSATRTTYKSIDFDGFCRMICAHRCNEEDASGPCKVEPRAGDDGAVFDLDLEETANLEFNRSLLDHLKNAVAGLTPKQLRGNPETQRFSWLLDGKVKKTLFVLCGDRVIYSWPATQEHSISEWSKTGKVWTAKALTDGTQASLCLWEPRGV